jgi:hypothetical protein
MWSPTRPLIAPVSTAPAGREVIGVQSARPEASRYTSAASPIPRPAACPMPRTAE